jgi:cytosine/uracil/thiamine/allantoin permease
MAKGSNPLKKIIGLAFLVVGIGLAIWAYQMSGSIGSQIKEVFSGTPTDKVMMMYIGSAVSAVIGLFLLIKK